MVNFRADLHCHSTCSDGSLSPDALVRLAKESGLSGISITDHDTIDAYADGMVLANELGLKWVPGVEFSAVHKGVSVHVLAYAFSLKSVSLKRFCAKHSIRRQERNAGILDRLAKRGMPVSYKELFSDTIASSVGPRKIAGRPHIAQVMVNKGYVSTVREAFDKYLAEGMSCYDPGQAISVEETIEYIHAAKGLAVIAHPHLIRNAPIEEALLRMPFDGIEGYYGNFHRSQEARWIALAGGKKWMVTGGSDFHGDIRPKIPLGCSWVTQETFDLLHKNFIEASKSAW